MVRRLRNNRKGFTLIELMIVISIIGILAAIAVPNYQVGVIKAREAVLRENLHSIRQCIDHFYADQGKYPDSLADLTDDKHKYMSGIPKDPFTKLDDWAIIAPPPPPEGATGGGGSVGDVHSNSDLIGTNGKPYNDPKEW